MPKTAMEAVQFRRAHDGGTDPPLNAIFPLEEMEETHEARPHGRVARYAIGKPYANTYHWQFEIEGREGNYPKDGRLT